MKFILNFFLVLALCVGICHAAEGKKKAPPTTLQIGIKEKGDCSRKAASGNRIRVHYTGTLFDDGSEFDSSVNRGTPFDFNLGKGQVIKGWDQGIVGMCVGERRKLVIPSAMGYGERGSPPVIPANAVLVFDVVLLDIWGERGESDL